MGYRSRNIGADEGAGAKATGQADFQRPLVDISIEWRDRNRAYWLRGNDGYAHHYLTTLTFHGYDGSGKYLVYTSVGLEGGVYGWYFYDQATCGCAGSSIYDIGAAGNPKFYEQDYREIPE